MAANMGEREHSTWDIMANAKPEEGKRKRRHGTNINEKLISDSYKSTVAIYSYVGGMWKIKL